MRKLLLLALAAVLFFTASAFAQAKYMRANIPFDFMVGTKHMPAGTYDLRITDDLQTAQLKNITTGDLAMIDVKTRLAEDPKHANEETLTFDVTPTKTILEAYWPRADAGFLFNVTPAKHTHKTVKLG